MSHNMHSKRGQNHASKRRSRLLAKRNVRFARRNWDVSPEQIVSLEHLSEELQLSVAAGDLRLLDRQMVRHPRWPTSNCPAQSLFGDENRG